MTVSRLTALLALSLAGSAATPTAARAQQDTLSLGEAVRRSLEVDPSVATAEAEEAAAAAGVTVAGAARYPSLGSTAQAVRFEEPMIVAPIHAFDIQNTPRFDRLLVQGRAELAYTLWDGGGRGARIAAARATESASGAGVRSARQEALARTVEAYLGVLTARDVGAAQAARLEELEAERDRVARFLDEGAAARVELLRADAELSAATAEEAAATARLELAEATLARRLDVPAAAVSAQPLREVALPDETPAEALDEALDGHPAVRAARARIEGTRAGVGGARSAWLPTVQANAAFVEYGGGSAAYQGEWQAGLRVDYPLFTGGRRSGAVERARAEERAAEAALESVRRDLGRAMDEARAAEREARSRLTALVTAVEQFEELARVEALALEEGVGVQRDFLRAQAGLLDARTGLAEARRAVVRARVRLAAALGRLTPEWIALNLETAS